MKKLLALLLAAVMLTGAFWGAENGVTTAPPYAWVSDVPAISMQESLQQEYEKLLGIFDED